MPSPPGFWVMAYLRDHFCQRRPAAVYSKASVGFFRVRKEDGGEGGGMGQADFLQYF